MTPEAKKYLLFYNNGQFETTDKINIAIIHMVDVGVIKIIFDCNENKAWIRSEEGIATEVKVTHVTGLT